MKKIGKYEILEELGRGGMGIVYRGYDSLLEREVAIKVLLEKSLEIPEVKSRFYREARTAGKLSHDNIAVVYELGEAEGKTYIAMEYLAGHDLRSIIDKKEPLTIHQKLDYAIQICKGLEHAHAHHVVHRDIKPENIRVLKDDRVKIIDFGIAKPQITSEEPVTGREVALTKSGTRIGTPWYMSPEQVRGVPVDHRSDIFSFGVLFYELLTYQKPFEGDDTTVLYKILHEQPAKIQLEESGLSEGLQIVLAKILAKNPDDRYSSATEMLKDISGIPEKARGKIIIQKMLAEGNELFEHQQLDQAILLYNEVLRLDPNHADAKANIDKIIQTGEQSSTLKVLSGNIAGETISHFKIIERIAGGGMGVVYKAEDVTLKRIIALKFLPFHRTNDPEAKKRFLKEAQLASALDHPNICTIHEVSETDEGLIFICMAYYKGENLREMVGRRKLDTSAILEIAIQIGKGLTKAHERGIIHRDIKPANIIMTEEGIVKIVDFGIAKLPGATRITRIGSMMGTLPFMSPEQVQGQEVDHRTDIWSFGALLYQITTGQEPFPGNDEITVPFAIVHGDYIPASKLRPEIPQELDAIINKSLKKAAQDRYYSAREMVDALETLRADQPKKAKPTREGDIARLIENGMIYLGKKEFNDALSRFEAALRLDPQNTEALSLAERCRREQHEYLKIGQRLAESKNYVEQGKLDQALEVATVILSVDSNHSETKALVKVIQEKMKHAELVDKQLSEAEYYLQREKYEQASKLYQEVLEIEPENKDATRGLKKAGKGVELTRSKPLAYSTLLRSKRKNRLKKAALWGVPVVAIGAVGVWLILSKTKVEEKIDLTGLAVTAKQTMLKAKETIATADVNTWAPETYAHALEVELHAENALSAAKYIEARNEFENARSLFMKAADEAKTKSEAILADLSKFREAIEQLKEQTSAEKANAEKVGGSRTARDLFESAVRKEQEGNKALLAGTKDNLLLSQKAFGEAREMYGRIISESHRIARLKEEAETNRLQAAEARKNVAGSEEAKLSSTLYQNAFTLELSGQKNLKGANIAGARDDFARATKLYAEANTEIARSIKNKQPLAEAERKQAEMKESRETEKKATETNGAEIKERDARESAQRDIQGLTNQYKLSLENRDLKTLRTLMNFSDEEANRWSAFFSIAEDIKASVNSKYQELTATNATVEIEVNLTFLNKTKHETARSELPPQSWNLQPQNGKWTIVSRK